MVQHGVVDARAWTRLWPWYALAAIAILTVAVVAHPGPLPGETGYVRALQRLGPPVPRVARLVRAWTTTQVDVVAAVALAPWLMSRRRARGAAAVAIVLVAMLVVQPIFKEVVDRPRPSAGQVQVRAVHTSESFPSGHALSTAAVCGLAVGLAARRRRVGLATAAAAPIALTALASGVQGVHWPSDTIAGLLTGALAARLALGALDPP